jgi:hypothetical protein
METALPFPIASTAAPIAVMSALTHPSALSAVALTPTTPFPVHVGAIRIPAGLEGSKSVSSYSVSLLSHPILFLLLARAMALIVLEVSPAVAGVVIAVAALNLVVCVISVAIKAALTATTTMNITCFAAVIIAPLHQAVIVLAVDFVLLVTGAPLTVPRGISPARYATVAAECAVSAEVPVAFSVAAVAVVTIAVVSIVVVIVMVGTVDVVAVTAVEADIAVPVETARCRLPHPVALASVASISPPLAALLPPALFPDSV